MNLIVHLEQIKMQFVCYSKDKKKYVDILKNSYFIDNLQPNKITDVELIFISQIKLYTPSITVNLFIHLRPHKT